MSLCETFPLKAFFFYAVKQAFWINPKNVWAKFKITGVWWRLSSPPVGKNQPEGRESSKEAPTDRLVLHANPPDCL